MKSSAVSDFISFIENQISDDDGVSCSWSLDFLRSSHAGVSDFSVFGRLQSRFFDVLDKLAALGPESSTVQGFSFCDKKTPVRDLESKLYESFGFYSLGLGPYIAGLLAFWAGVVKALVETAKGFGVVSPSGYLETDGFISRYITFFQSVFFRVVPDFQNKGPVLLDLDEILYLTRAFMSKEEQPVYNPGMGFGFYLRVDLDGPSMVLSQKANRLELFLVEIFHLDFVFDYLLNVVLPGAWKDLRSGGCDMMSRQYEGVKPFVDFFSVAPLLVSRDERLFKTLYSLKDIKSNRRSNEFKETLSKNDTLLDAAKKIMKTRCPQDVEAVIDEFFELSRKIYKKWVKDRTIFHYFEKKAEKRAAFYELVKGIAHFGRSGECLFGNGGRFSDAVADSIVKVLDQSDGWNNPDRAVNKILVIFLEDKFHFRYPESTIKRWYGEIKEKNDQKKIMSILNL